MVPTEMASNESPLSPSSRWHWLLAAMIVAVSIGAFATLLGDNYSPQDYRAARGDYGLVGVVWLQGACIEALVLLAFLSRRLEECRRFVKAGWVVTAASVFVLLKRLLGAPPQCLDPILFCTACGWTMTLWLRDGTLLDNNLNGSPRGGRMFRHLSPAALLQGVVWSATAGLFAYYLAQQIRYLDNLALGYPDCGDAARIMHNTINNPHELLLRVNPDTPLFYDHFYPGIALLVPLWILWPDLKLTILLQVISVLGPALPLYWIGKRLFHDKVAALLLVTAWLVYPSTSQFIYSGSYGFHWGNVCLLLYFLALACWIHQRCGWACLFALWAVLIKEEATIVFGTFGLYLALCERRRWLGVAIAATAFGHFFLTTSVILPAMSQRGVYPELNYFSDLGATKWEIFLSPWVNPRLFWGRLLSPSTFYFAALLLAPLLFVPLRKTSVLLTGSLVFLFDCLVPFLKSICFWYQASLLPVAFWALATALQTANQQWRRAALVGAVVAGLLLSAFFGNTFWSKSAVPPPPSHGRLHLVQRMASRIDPHGSLFATQRVAAHFIAQKYLYLNAPLPKEIDYVLLDLRDARENMLHLRRTPLVHWLDYPLEWLRTLQRKVEARPDLHLVDAEDGLLLYAKDGNALDRRKLVERDSLPPDAILQRINLGGGPQIVGYTIEEAPAADSADSGLVRVTIFSQIPAPTNTDIAVRCILEGDLGAGRIDRSLSAMQPLGQGIWPVARWETNRFYADPFLVSLPNTLPAGTPRLRFEYAVLSE